MSYDKQKEIVEVLSDSTYSNPMPVRDIAEICNIHESHITCPSTRQLILKAMKTFGVAIGSDNRGYYTIRTAHEMQRYLNTLLKRQIAITERIDTVYKAYHS